MIGDKGQVDDFNRIFPYKVCINLDRRPERWERMKERFVQHRIMSVERFSGMDGQKMNVPDGWPYSAGHYGCLQSHLAVLKMAQEKKAPNIFIFEDDCIFDPEFNKNFAHYFNQLPGQWDMLLLGGTHFEDPVKISDNIARPRMTYLTHAYALNCSIYDALVELCEQGLRAIDDYTAELQKRFDCYCFMPDLVWQERIDSDTREAKG